MSDTATKYLITSALPYANGPLHLGHLAGAYLPADIYVRYLRLLGKDVVWVCGSDEHGAAITIKAKKEKISPKEIIDKYHELNKSSFERLGISFDIYHRTSEALHHDTSQEFFLKLFNKGGELEAHSTDQYYDKAYEQFLADRYIVGTCPRCGFDSAYGDQCENCGSDLSPTELISPRSTLSGKAPVLKNTTHWYFNLDKHETWLRDWIANGQLDGEQHHDPKEWRRHVIGQCLSWLDGGLKARSVTRDLSWGIPVPLDDAEGKVLYVWFDAPIGYISATKQWAKDHGKDWESYWKGDNVELIHFIGKDNIVFHCIVFPAMLKAYGDFVLPKNVPANQFLNFEGQKFSKSRGWGIEQHAYLEEFKEFPNSEDALRYALIRNLPENKDSDFRWDDFVDFHDKELADNLGNFVNRVIVLTNKYYEGKVPEEYVSLIDAHPRIIDLTNNMIREIEQFSFRPAILLLMEISSYGNSYLQEVSPWAIWKENPDSKKIANCMSACIQLVTLISALSEPFLPFTAARLRNLLQIPGSQNGDLATILERLKQGENILPAPHTVGQPEVLFPKIYDRKDNSRLKIIERQKEKLQAILEAEHSKERSPIKETIQFDDFTKLDLRTGTIIAAAKVTKAKKLLKLTVDLELEQRTIVSGIAEYFKAEEVVGQQVIVVANLAPKKLKGIESQGMILMVENEKGELGFVNPSGNWGNGLIVR